MSREITKANFGDLRAAGHSPPDAQLGDVDSSTPPGAGRPCPPGLLSGEGVLPAPVIWVAKVVEQGRAAG